MFSVTKTELKVFALSDKNVWPTKSGVTSDRRDKVLIGFFTPELFILSIFSRRYDSTKGPFFNDLAIICKQFVIRESSLRFLPRSSSFQNKTVARLMFTARLESFGQLSPWANWMMTASSSF